MIFIQILCQLTQFHESFDVKSVKDLCNMCEITKYMIKLFAHAHEYFI